MGCGAGAEGAGLTLGRARAGPSGVPGGDPVIPGTGGCWGAAPQRWFRDGLCPRALGEDLAGPLRVPRWWLRDGVAFGRGALLTRSATRRVTSLAGRCPAVPLRGLMPSPWERRTLPGVAEPCWGLRWRLAVVLFSPGQKLRPEPWGEGGSEQSRRWVEGSRGCGCPGQSPGCGWQPGAVQALPPSVLRCWDGSVLGGVYPKGWAPRWLPGADLCLHWM